jgi:uncharacterized protein YbjT (DUF2867 family)
MPAHQKTALLVGATGLVGGELLSILLTASEYGKIKIFTRKKIDITHPKLEQILVNFDNLADYKEHLTVTDVYCCLGTTIKKAGSQDVFRKVDYEYPLVLAELSKEYGVEKFLIITAMGANSSSKVFYSRVKGEVEDAIKKVGISSLHFFRPSLLLGKRQEFRFGEHFASILSPIYSFFLVGSLRKYKPIQAKSVASAMYHAGQKHLPGNHIYLSHQIEDLS